MDIGTPKEPGRVLNNDEAREIGGGYVLPDDDPTRPPEDDPLGPPGTPLPVDYSTP
jgi:hypothetical protein